MDLSIREVVMLTFALGFGIGVAVGVTVAVIVIASSNLVRSPFLASLEDCMTNCSKTHDWGSPEFWSCVGMCMGKKMTTRRGGSPHPA